MTIILIGALIVVLGGIIGAFGTFQHNKSSSAKSTRIEEGVNATSAEVIHLRKENQNLIARSNELNNKIDTQLKTIDALRKENIDLYAKLASSSLDIYNNLTGGDSYCYCFFIISRANPSLDIGNILFKLGDKSKSPLRNVSARIVDLNSYNIQQPTFDDAFKNIIHLETIEIKGSIVLPNKFHLDKQKGVNLNIFFSANNGDFTQLLRMRFIDGEWASAILVNRNEKNIFEQVDKNYPEKDITKIFK